MGVLVTGLTGRPLMPTTNCKARKLIKNNKAVIVRRHPFTIRLLYRTGSATQAGHVGEDTGSQNIGISVTVGNKVIIKDEHILRSSMEKRKLMETRKEYRRGRRYRKPRTVIQSGSTRHYAGTTVYRTGKAGTGRKWTVLMNRQDRKAGFRQAFSPRWTTT